MSRTNGLRNLLIWGLGLFAFACLCLIILGPVINTSLFENSRFAPLDWSSEDQLAFIASQGGSSDFMWFVYTVDADGKHVKKLSNKSVQASAFNRNGEWLGNKLLIPLSTGGSDPELFLIDPTNKRSQQLTDNDLYEFQFAVSPDGEQIILWGTSYQPTRKDGLYLLSVQGGDLELLQGSDLELVGSGFNWSPDGEFVAFRFGPALYGVQISVGEIYPLNEAGQDVLQFQWADDGTRLFYSTETDTYTVPAEGGDPSITTELTLEDPPPGILSADGKFRAKEGCSDPSQPPEYTATLDIFPCSAYELHILNAADNSLHAKVTREALQSSTLLRGAKPIYAVLVLLVLGSPLLALPYLFKRRTWLAWIVIWVLIADGLLLIYIILNWLGVL